MKKLVVLFALLALLVSACGSDADEPAATAGDSAATSDDTGGDAESDSSGSAETGEQSEATDEAASTTDSADEPEPINSSDASGELVIDAGSSFCDVARDLDENDPFADIDLSDGFESFYNEALAIWADIVLIAPSEIQADIAIIRDQFAEQRDVAAKYDFDLDNLELAAEIDSLDWSEADAAQLRLDAWLAENCGLVGGNFDDGDFDDGDFDDGEGFDDLPPLDEDLLARAENGDPAATLALFFGVDIEVAECIADELDLNADDLLSEMDPSTITDPICGTTMLDVISGGG